MSHILVLLTNVYKELSHTKEGSVFEIEVLL